MMIDKPYYIALEVTRKCNLNCIHCFEKGVFQCFDDMSDEKIWGIVSQIKAIAPFSFCVCGGEPTLRLSLVEEIIRELRDVVQDLSMVTNGTLITSKDLIRLKRDGLKNIQFSIDGPTSEMHDFIRNKAGCYSKTMRAVEDALDAGLNVVISYTCMKQNVLGFAEFVEKMESFGKNVSIVASPVIQMGNGNNSGIVPCWSEYRKILETVRVVNDEQKRRFVTWVDPFEIDGYSEQAEAKNAQLYIDYRGCVLGNPYRDDFALLLDDERTIIDAWKQRQMYYEKAGALSGLSIYEKS